jgi:hypothetical protein
MQRVTLHEAKREHTLVYDCGIGSVAIISLDKTLSKLLLPHLPVAESVVLSSRRSRVI